MKKHKQYKIPDHVTDGELPHSTMLLRRLQESHVMRPLENTVGKFSAPTCVKQIVPFVAQ